MIELEEAMIVVDVVGALVRVFREVVIVEPLPATIDTSTA